MDVKGRDELADIRRLRARILLGLVGRFSPYRRAAAATFLVVTAWIVFADGAPWRIAAACAGYAVLILGDRKLASHKRRLMDSADASGREAALFRAGMPFLMGLHGLVIFATGGLFSPMLLVMFVPATVTAMFDDFRIAGFVIGTQLLSLWIYAAIHLFTPLRVVPTSLYWGDQGPSALAVLAVAAVATTVLGMAHIMGRWGREALDQQLIHLVRARDVARSTLSERTQELTTLSGEIAHELKNPLASVKGLAALIGRDLEGRSAERCGVMRREVDRMQSILDEFLNFSRPLVPLSIKKIPLLQVATEVAELHEGTSDQGVELKVIPAIHTEVECDPRKVKQILVNLVQNALDVAPAGSAVELVLEPDENTVALDVLDRGPGLDEAAAGRMFEAGVTTKDTGSGLGLTVARAIAQQHGGELRLEPRVPGPGARAVLVLPRHQPMVEPDEETEPPASEDEVGVEARA